MGTPDDEIARRIEAARTAKGLSQADLAAFMTSRGYEFTRQTVYKIENVKRRVLAAELISIADCLGLTASELLGLGADRAPILLAGARIEESQRNLQTAANAYGRAVLSYAQAADDATNLHENDAAFARDSLPRQTPAWIASMTCDNIRASLRREPEQHGEHVQAVIESLNADYRHHHGTSDG